jgi:hypothetical protein
MQTTADTSLQLWSSSELRLTMSAEMAMTGTTAAFGLPCAIEVLQRFFAFDLTKVKAEHRPDDGLYVHSVALWLNACRLTSCFATYFSLLLLLQERRTIHGTIQYWFLSSIVSF